jgi:hypothetical protein
MTKVTTQSLFLVGLTAVLAAPLGAAAATLSADKVAVSPLQKAMQAAPRIDLKARYAELAYAVKKDSGETFSCLPTTDAGGGDVGGGPIDPPLYITEDWCRRAGGNYGYVYIPDIGGGRSLCYSEGRNKTYIY